MCDPTEPESSGGGQDGGVRLAVRCGGTGLALVGEGTEIQVQLGLLKSLCFILLKLRRLPNRSLITWKYVSRCCPKSV